MQVPQAKDVASWLRTMEECHPLRSDPDGFPLWHDLVWDAWKSFGFSADGPEASVLEGLLAARKVFHEAAFTQGAAAAAATQPDESWRWLLDHPQVEQRTAEWYAEARDLLTASEIGDIWKGPGTRAAVVMRKVREPVAGGPTPRTCVPRAETNAMLWGQRYEPVVKRILEEQTGSRILELGRIRHRQVARLAASPDGLFLDGSQAGRLVEIKCPPTRTIEEGKIPQGYWCQMQLQMEVCDRPVCEYVEAKFVEGEAAEAAVAEGKAVSKGCVSLLTHTDTFENRYAYHTSPEDLPQPEEPWVIYETYPWACTQLRRILVLRDREWFAQAQPLIQQFWIDVEAGRSGTWQPPPSRPRRPKAAAAAPDPELCAIVDDSAVVADGAPSAPSQGSVALCGLGEPPEPTFYTEPGTTEMVS